MRADSALSHLHDGELCVVTLKDGTRRNARWNRPAWCFFLLDTEPPAVCGFDDIAEWRPASIRP